VSQPCLRHRIAFFRHSRGSRRPAPSRPGCPVPDVDQSAVRQRRLFLCRRKICREPARDHAGSDYVEVLAQGCAPALSARCSSMRAQTPQLDGNADGRKGGRYLSSRLRVYMIDQPMRGRPLASGAARPHVHGRQRGNSIHRVEECPAPGRRRNAHPMAARGPTRAQGDPISMPFTPRRSRRRLQRGDPAAAQGRGRRCSTKIGPIVLTHSQSGAFGWLIADAGRSWSRPSGDRPSGPPLSDHHGTEGARLGPDRHRITYDPGQGRSELRRAEAAPDARLFACWMQKAPARAS